MMEVDPGGLGLAEVMTGALREGDHRQGQPSEGAFSELPLNRFIFNLFHIVENVHLSAKGGYIPGILEKALQCHWNMLHICLLRKIL